MNEDKLKGYIEERMVIAERERENAESDHQKSFWMGRHTLLGNLQDFIEFGVFDDDA